MIVAKFITPNIVDILTVGASFTTLQRDICFALGIDRSKTPEVFCKKTVLKNTAKCTEKRMCQSLFLNRLTGLRLRHRYFPVNFAKFIRTTFL